MSGEILACNKRDQMVDLVMPGCVQMVYCVRHKYCTDNVVYRMLLQIRSHSTTTNIDSAVARSEVQIG